MKNIVTEWFKTKQRSALATAITDTKQPKPKPALMMQLEPRIMFDGAAIATAVDVAHTDAKPAGIDAPDHHLAPPPAVHPVDLSVLATPITVEAAKPATEIVFIDGSLPDTQQLQYGVKAGVEVVILDPTRNGLNQIADYLEGREGIDAIHIVSHGHQGEITLGSFDLNQTSLSQQTETLARIGNSLSADGDILLYGCQVGGGEVGNAFITQLAALTHADVAASIDNTGNTSLLANWTLEKTIGAVDHDTPFTADLLADYQHVLPTTLVAGDIAVIGFNADDDDSGADLDGDGRSDIRWAIMAMRDLDIGTVIHFTDAGFKEDGSFLVNNANEGHLTWTLTSAVSAGKIFVMDTADGSNFNDLNGATAGTGGLSDYGTVSGGMGGTPAGPNTFMASTGDQIIVYQGTSGTTTGATFIYALSTSQNGLLTGNGVWQTNGAVTGQQQSYLPTGLTNGTSALALTTNLSGVSSTTTGGAAGAPNYGFDNMVYQGTLTGTRAQLLAAIGNPSNWAGNDTIPFSIGVGSGFSFASDFTVTQPPTLVSGTFSDNALKIGETSTVTFTFSTAVSGFTTADLTVPNGGITGLSTSDGGTTWTGTFTPNASVTDATNVITVDLTGVTSVSGSLAGTGTADSTNYAIDTVRPTASIVVADNDLAVGETSGVTITFSEAVTGFTNADLTIANGTLSTVGSINGGITWTATLTPTASITDTTNVITLANTGVADTAGNAGTGTTNSNNYAIDTARPTATIVVADNVLSIGETSLVTITFSEAVSGFDNSALTVANGTLSTVSTSDDITFTATFTPTASITDATNLITLDNTYVADAAGNSGSGTTNSNNYAVDTVRPTVSSITRVNTATSNATSVQYTVVFSENVTGVDTSDFALTTSGTSGSISAISGSGDTYTVTVSSVTGDGTLRMDLNGSGTGITDIANNPVNTGFTSGQVYTFDHTAPAIGTPDLMAASDSGVSSSDNLTNKTTPNFTGTAEASSTVTLYDTDGTTVLGTTTANGMGKWTITSSTLTEGAHMVSAKSTDAVGNVSSASSKLTVTIDTTAPVTAPDAPTLDSGTDSGVSNSDNITNYTGPDFIGTGANANSLVNVYSDGTLLGTTLSDGSGNYTYSATFLTDGTHLITAKNVDNAGNIGPASSSFSLTIDTNTPSTTISTIAFSADTGASSTDFITKSAAQTISGTTSANLVASEIVEVSLDNGNTWSTATTSVGSNTFSLSGQTLTASDTLQVRVSDLAGNANTAATQAYVLDTTSPTTTVATASFSADTGTSSTDFITKTAAQTLSGTTSANLVSGEIVEVSLDNGSTWATATTSVGTDTWSLSGQTLTASNTLKVRVADTAGNLSAALSQAYVLDTTAPTVAVVVADNALAVGETSLVTFTFSQAVSGFDNSDLTIANGTLTAVSSGDGGITYTATFTPTASITDTTNLITVDNTGVADVAGNAGTGTTNSNNYAIDNVRPTASIVVADNALKVGETSLVTITFSEAVTGFTNADLTIANGSLSAVSSSDGGITWTATFTPTASVTDATNLITLANTGVADAAGNAGSGTTDSNNYAIDTARPTASIVVADTALATGETSLVTITFSEAVTGFTNADLTIANGTLSAVSSSDGGITWTATLTPTASITDATNLITLANTGVQDAAGNAGTGTTDSNNYAVNTLNPVVTSVTATTANGAYKVGDTISIDVSFDAAVTVDATGGTPTLQLETGSVDRTATYVSGSGGTVLTFSYTIQSGDTSPDLDYLSTSALALNGATIRDNLNNDVTLTLATPGTANSLGANKNIQVDSVVPTASIVVADNALKVGETSLVTITFSEAVTGFTNADLTIANGTLSAVSSSDGGITWTATLTPTAAINDTTNLITLDNTGVQDAAGNTGTGTTDSNNYVIDTVRPTASIVVADTALAAGETSLVTITFSEAVIGFTNADLTIANGTLSAVSSSDGGITWTATLTPTASITDTTNVITLANTGVTDISGNAGTGTTDSNNYAIDTQRPTATIVVADTALKAGETSLVTITMSEAVANFDNADLTIANGTLSNVVTSDGGITWTATLTPTADITDTTNLITFDTTGVIDGAGNTGAGPVNSNNYAIDTLRPTASILVADTSLTIGETSLVTITFNEAVSGFTAVDLNVANGFVSGLSSSDGGITWTATLTPTAPITDSTNVIKLANTGVQDAAGNTGTGTTDSNNYAIDNVRPTASIVVADNALAAGETSLVTFTFNEAVTGFTTADLTVANGSLSGLSSSDGGITWTATLTPTANITDTTNLITLANTGVNDLAGNAGTGTTDSNNYAIDTLRPTATIVVADNALKAGETSLVTITFSEAVSNFNNGDLSVSNGSLSNVSSSDGGITWTATLTPSANVTDTTNLITLANTGVTDAAGNTGTGTTDSNNYAIDTLRPSAIITVADSALAVGETSLVTITFNEAVTGFTNADLTIANGTLTPVSSTDGGVTWTATFTPTAGISDTTNVISIDESGVLDAAGNAGSGITDSNNYTIDSVRPTGSVVIADTALNGTETTQVTITFSEAVTGFTNADLTIANGTLSPVSSADGGVTWTATFTPTAGITNSTNLISLNIAGVQDVAGNTGTGTADSNNYQIDTLVPTVGSVSVPAGVTYNTGDVLTFTLNTSETVLVNTAGGTPRIALDIGGTTAYATYVAGSNTNTLVFQYTVKAGDNDANGISVLGLSANSGTLRDAAGNNLNVTLNNVGSTAALNVDTIAPTFTSQVQGSPNSYEQGVNFVVNFSEAVDHVDVTDFSLVTTDNATATLNNFQQINDHSWLVSVTNISGNGTVRVDVKATNDITDSAGNALSGSLTGSGGFAAQPLPVLPVPPTPAPLATTTVDAPTPTQAPAPLIVLSPDSTSIGGSTNNTPLTTVEAPSLATVVPIGLSVGGASNTPSSLDTSIPGTDPIGVVTATSTGNIGAAPGSSHISGGGSYTPTGPGSGPTIDRLNTNSDSGLQNMPIVGRVEAQAGVPLYIPLPNSAPNADANQQLSVDVRMHDGKALVPWLRFDPVTGSLSGQAPKGFEGKLQIQVTVRDSKGNSSSSIVELQFSDNGKDSKPLPAKETPAKAKPGASIMGKPGLNDQFALYGKGAHQLETDALLSALNQHSIITLATARKA